ncbi:MAG: glycogen/starch/alpha-glucan phosphorylase [Opitutales bacterium]|nr:glycogen/starch/alpha-glucan phosphorylase [Opitutales bacterium]
MAKNPNRKSETPKECKFYVGSTVEDFKNAVLWHLERSLARSPKAATTRDWWNAGALAVRDQIMGAFISTMSRQHDSDKKRVYYLSLEYLMGRLTEDTLINTGLMDVARKAYAELGLDFDKVMGSEVDMGLGNGGLGRLAACFQDSLATLDYPAVGYGILYEFGLFTQSFEKGRQIESPDNWLKFGSPWDIVRPENTVKIGIGGRVEGVMGSSGDWQPRWIPAGELLGVPWDVPVVGYGAGTVNFLRLWESRATNELDLSAFNEGGYTQAVHQKAMSETISKVLYPNDKTENGKVLRLVQQYFFVTCSLQDIIRRFKNANGNNWDVFPDKVCIQLNDTHPAIAVAELMRLLVDVENLGWDKSWSLCRRVFAYTNHTLLPEALEKWPVPMFEKVLPRHLQIIYEINSRWLKHVESVYGKDDEKLSRLSIIEEGPAKMVRMAYLSVVGSFSVNGVAALHSELLKESVLRDFYQISPEKFNNKTNGITPRRWLKTSNEGLSSLITKTLKTDAWVKNLDLLRGLEPFAGDAKFRAEYMQIKRDNKVRLAKIVKNICGVELNPDSIFDVQIKRLHEYKRQHLNLLYILTLYRRLLHNPDLPIAPKSYIFGAKAAPGYDLAKNIIWAINTVGNAINNDKRINGKLKVAFLPNYNVSLAMDIIPAADVSEQISTAGKEASGTGNMKLALNGAITIGTLDGANVEIAEEVGGENLFIFGLTVDEVQKLKAEGYNPWDFYNSNPELKSVLDWLVSEYFMPGNPSAFEPLRKSVLDWGDPFMVCTDYKSYCDAQDALNAAYLDKERWAKMAILNTARMGKFSSDRTIRQYAEEIWRLSPVPPAGK